MEGFTKNVCYMDTNLDIKKDIKEFQLATDIKKSEDQMDLMKLAILLGYKTMPVDIDTFLDDKYYMGNVSKNLYPFWRVELRKIFPTPLHTSTPIIVFTGSIGTGKSTAVRFMFEYMKHRLCCLRNPHDTFGMVPGKNIKFDYFHRSAGLAQTDFVDVLDSWESESPYFKQMYEQGNLDFIEQACDSTRSNNTIGSDVICYVLSEANFISYDKAEERIDMALKRWYSRYDRFIKYFGIVVIDSSSQGDDSVVDNFIQHNPYGDLVRTIFTNHWKVREHLHYYFQKGSFQIYCGDATHDPFIVDPSKGRVFTSDMDPDRLIDAPMELKPNAEFNLITFLQDTAGISTSSTDIFISDKSSVTRNFMLPQFGADVVKFDFYDKTDKFIYRFDRTLQEIPSDRIIFIRSDIGVVKDNMGLAISYFDKWKIYDENKKIRNPIIKVPLAVGINRYDDQETSISHLFEFVMDLSERFEIGGFSADQFASRQLLQDLTREKIPNRYLSVDRTDTAYILCKSLFISDCLQVANNEWCRNEFLNLRRVGQGKVDHPESGGNGHGTHSKDISDAVAGCVQDLYDNIDKAGQLSIKYKVTKYTEHFSERAMRPDNEFQDMLGGIYG